MKQKLPPEDLRLWKINTQDVKPLSKDLVPQGEVFQEPSPPKKQPIVKKKVYKQPEETPLSSLGRKEIRRLKIEARFDMHGLTLAEGYDALEAFLHSAQEKGLKTVLVITGKGSMSADNTLRRQLPRWLEETPLRHLVASLPHPAKLQDGGTGAFYVEVRKKAKSRPLPKI